jgi:hypothetical protein
MTTLRAQSLANIQTNAIGPATDNRHFVFEVLHVLLPLISPNASRARFHLQRPASDL